MKSEQTYEATHQQPDEINELRRIVSEYVKRRNTMKTEIETLKEGLKDLREEYENKIDLKTLDKVERYVFLRQSVNNRATFDLLLETIAPDELQ